MRTKIYSAILGKTVRVPASVSSVALALGGERGEGLIRTWLAGVEARSGRDGLSLGRRVRMRPARKPRGKTEREDPRGPETEILISSYAEHLAAIGLSPLTAESQASILRRAVLPCAMSGGRIPRGEVGRLGTAAPQTTAPHLWARILSRSLLSYCSARGMSAGEIRKAYAAAGGLVDWMASIGAVPPDHKIAPPPLPRRAAADGKSAAPRLLSTGDVQDLRERIEALIRAALAPGGAKLKNALRTWAEVGLMAAYAVRPGEAGGANADDFEDGDGGPTFDVRRQATASGYARPKAGSFGRATALEGRGRLALAARDALTLLADPEDGGWPARPPREQTRSWEKERRGTPYQDFSLKDFRREAARRLFTDALPASGHDGALEAAARQLRHTNALTTACYLRLGKN